MHFVPSIPSHANCTAAQQLVLSQSLHQVCYLSMPVFNHISGCCNSFRAYSRRFCACREACLKGQGFWDPFKPVKDEENKKAVKLLPGVLK